jgi:hypothetical protein
MQVVKYLCLFILPITYGVSDGPEAVGADSGILYDTTSVRSGKYAITVTSKYIQTNKEERPVCLAQQVKLFYRDVEVYNKPHKSKIKTQTINGKRVNYLDNDIIEIGIVEGRKDSVFSILGYGGCMWCTEYDELLNKKGESIYLLYHDKQKVYQSHGSMKAVCSKYGIPLKDGEQKYSRKSIIVGK